MSLGLAIFVLGILAMMIWSPGFRRTVIVTALVGVPIVVLFLVFFVK